MATLRMRIAAPKQVSILQGEIVRYRAEIRSIDEELSSAQSKLELDTASAQSLRIRIGHAKQRLAAQNRHLSDLGVLAGEYDETGDGSFENVEPLSEQIALRTKEISILSLKLQEMTEELYATEFILSVSKVKIETLKTRRQAAVESTEKLSMAFSVLHDVPDEVWAAIFQLCLEKDVLEYTDLLGLAEIRHTPLILGQVCSVWRRIVRAQRGLWHYFICGFVNKSVFQKEQWDYYTSLNPGSLIVIISLRTLSKAPLLFPHMSSKEDFPSSRHPLRLLSAGFSESNIEELPFKDQESLFLHLDNRRCPWIFDGVRENFNSLVNLTITAKGHTVLPGLYLNGPTSRLKTLKIDIGTFEPFPIHNYGYYPTMRELHIHHDGINELQWCFKVLHYSKLEVLGVTPPDVLWFDRFWFPSLRQLVLYGPKSQTLPAPSLRGLSQHDHFDRIRELELHKWPLYEPTPNSSWNIMPLLLEIAGNLRSVETIRCVDSFIDGKGFVSLVKLLTDTSGTLSWANLKKVVVNRCSGITREDCDAIAALVESFSVYV